MKTSHLASAALCVTWLCASVTSAVVTNSTSGGLFATIQDAVDAAVDGDVLLVSTGMYAEHVTIVQKYVEILGGWSPDFTTRQGLDYETSITPGTPGSVLTAVSNAVVFIELLELQGGTNVAGGGMLLNNGTVVTTLLCTVHGGSALVGGGVGIGTNCTYVARSTVIAVNSAILGGGIYLAGGPATTVILEDDVTGVLGNSARIGAGIYSDGGHVVVQDGALVRGNTGQSAGGGIYAFNDAMVEIRDGAQIGTPLQGNHVTNSESRGGGIFAENATVVIEGSNCHVVGNSTGELGGGGGIYASNSLLVIRNHASIGGLMPYAGSSNSSYVGGGVFAYNSRVVVTNGARIQGNDARQSGGGIAVAFSDYLVDGATIGSTDGAGNHSAWYGGGLVSYFSSGMVVNSSIDANSALIGGGIYATDGSNVVLRATSVSYNKAGQGGALHAEEIEDGCILDNVAVISNVAAIAAGLNLVKCGVSVISNNSLIAGNVATNGVGVAYLDHASLEVYDSAVAGNQASNYVSAIGVSYGDLRCVDSLVCNNRLAVQNSLYQNAGSLYIVAGRMVIEAVNRAVLVTNNSGLLGGAVFVGGNGVLEVNGLSNQVLFADNTASNGGAVYLEFFSALTASFSGAVLFSGNRAESGGAVYAERSPIMVTVTNGHAPAFIGNVSWGTSPGAGGGAILANRKAKLVARNAVFRDNVSSNKGGAVWLRASRAEFAGLFDGSPQGNLPPVVFSNNVAGGEGGALLLTDGSAALLSDALVNDNTAFAGAGVYVDASTADLVNVVLAGNSSGIRPNVGSKVRCLHCTIVDNGGLGVAGTGLNSLTNCIVRGQSVQIDPGNDVQYSNVEGGYPGAGNIDTNPLFYSVSGGDLRLRPTSPSIDTAVATWLTNDALGTARPQGAAPDMGAYETRYYSQQEIWPTEYDFGDVVPGDTVYTTVTVFNTGTVTLNGMVQGVLTPVFTVLPVNYAVPYLGSNMAVVSFAPTMEGMTWTNVVTFSGTGGDDMLTLMGAGVPEPCGGIAAVFALLSVMWPSRTAWIVRGWTRGHIGGPH